MSHQHGTLTEKGIYNLIFGPGGAAFVAGTLEIALFHPFDTMSKRLMKNTTTVVVPGDYRASAANFQRVVFSGLIDAKLVEKHGADAAKTATAEMKAAVTHSLTPVEQLRYLYPGGIYAVYYKVLQRLIKFAGQPYAKDYLDGSAYHHGALSVFGPRRGKMWVEATAGCLVGVTEVVLLPIDRMKVLSQTNTGALQGRSLFRVMIEEGITKMYAAAGTTAMRNAAGSFLLFGGAAFTKEYIFGLEDYRKATLTQNLVSSTVGACTGVLTTSPLDVVKTRIQSRNFANKAAAATAASSNSTAKAPVAPASGFTIVAETLKREGPSAFFKGITPKIITTAPRLVFSFTVTQQLTPWFRERGRALKGTSSSSSK